ncbi:MAG: hypothetical protein CL678_05415 [Bdellovibrionaceae bacterium]|nr:hypothetical protein [Pseudobdellovibrionaceae bacterium]|tara:strand:+ start:940 stop:1815 length:876 start_codon:yes stop_codon:yes gene_type:complete
MRTVVFLSLLIFSLTGKSEVFRKRVSSFDVIERDSKMVLRKYPPSSVWFVFDNDNTLLKMKRILGSDAWFDWQRGELGKKKNDSVGKNFKDLLFVQGVLYSFGEMTLTEQKALSFVQFLKRKKAHWMIQTSRGSDFFYSTVRELLVNRYIDLNESLVELDQWKEPIVPFQSQNELKKEGFTPQEILKFKFDRKPRKVLMNKGVLMGAGQHKGGLLRLFFKKIKETPQAIIFVDDQKTNVDAMVEAWRTQKTHLYAFDFIKEHERAQRFKDGSKTQVKQQWDRIKQGGKRWK